MITTLIVGAVTLYGLSKITKGKAQPLTKPVGIYFIGNSQAKPENGASFWSDIGSILSIKNPVPGTPTTGGGNTAIPITGGGSSVVGGGSGGGTSGSGTTTGGSTGGNTTPTPIGGGSTGGHRIGQL